MIRTSKVSKVWLTISSIRLPHPRRLTVSGRKRKGLEERM
uniref:Putative 4K protein n=1 Tax=Youcai mosaic virus TaxID=228578 RepID=H6X0P5_YOMV|nr:putative 4K protein [Youcai mosaic virus]